MKYILVLFLLAVPGFAQNEKPKMVAPKKVKEVTYHDEIKCPEGYEKWSLAENTSPSTSYYSNGGIGYITTNGNIISNPKSYDVCVTKEFLKELAKEQN